MKQNLEQEVRELWSKASHPFTSDEIEIFFDEQFDAEATTAVRHDGKLVACGQWSERKMTFVGLPVAVGLIQGIMVDPKLKPAERSASVAELLAEIHRQQFARGVMYSVVIPTDTKQRQWLESQGYMTASHRLTVESKIPEGFVADTRTEVKPAEEWGKELWLYYAQHGGMHDYELKLSEGDFFAMLARHDARGGHVLVARRHGKIVGLALAQCEGKPLKSGKASEKQFRINIKYVLATDANVLHTMQQCALALEPHCRQLVMEGGCPAKGFKGAQPFAMMRTICMEKFLTFVANTLPGLQLVATIDGDNDLPQNNATYRLRDGRCYVSPFLNESRMTSGGIPAMLLSGQPVQIPFA